MSDRIKNPDYIWELPFWLCFVCWALLPALLTPWIELAGIPISTKDILVVFLAGYYSVAPKPWGRGNFSRRSFNFLLISMFFTVFMMLSMLFYESDAASKMSMFYTCVLFVCALIIGYRLIQGRSHVSAFRFLVRLAVCVILVGLVYFAESFFSLGLRSDQGSAVVDFGIQRVKGPLFGAATGHFILIPAFGVILASALAATTGRRPRVLMLMLGAACLITVVGLGSRAGLLTLASFAVLACAFANNIRQQLYFAGLILLFGLISIAILSQKADLSRYTSAGDSTRSETYETALRIVTDPLNWSIFGRGYGSIWSWYLPDVESGGAYRSGSYFIWTEHGVSLYHPHSTPLMLIAELGLVGALYYLCICFYCIRSMSMDRSVRIFTASVTASLVATCFDFFLFKSAILSCMWWIFFFGSCHVTGSHGKIAFRQNPRRAVSS